ncbi:MAG: DNA polymerase/3'-5' exonuclease PolX [bacterium]
MANKELAHIIYLISIYLEMEGMPFRPVAYRKAAFSIEATEEDVSALYRREGLRGIEKIPGVGSNIAQRIEEYIKTGKISYYEEFKKGMPVDLDDLLSVEGIGPKSIRDLYLYRKVKNLKDLEIAAKNGKLRDIPNFGLKTETNIIEAINFLKRDQGRSLIGTILPIVEMMCKDMRENQIVDEVTYAGSLRRMKETIGDVDLLAVSNKPEEVMNYFVSQKGVKKVWGKGKTKTSIRMADGFDVDLRVVPKKSYGSALQYFTGSKEHNIALRRIAIQNNLKLNEYGIFRGSKMLPSDNEIDIYRALKMAWIPPEMRENNGEIEQALKNNLPKLVNISDIQGDLHCHSDWDGGVNSIRQMAEAGMGRGYQYIGISDHTKFLKIENGLDEKQLMAQKKEIKRLNNNYRQKGIPFTILHGCETNILADGRVDIDDNILEKLDYVIAGVHSQFNMPTGQMTDRIIKTMKNPNVDIISHPTGRLLKKREGYNIDFGRILTIARETGTILEINSSDERLDLNDKNIRRGKENNVKMIINTDSHDKKQLAGMRYGIGQARRGWASKEDIINTLPTKKLMAHFK